MGETPRLAARALGWGAAVAVFWVPLAIVVFTAVKSEPELFNRGVLAFPSGIEWRNFREAWDLGRFGIYFRNSALLVATKVPLGILLASLAAYPLAKVPFPLRTGVFLFFLAGLSVPVHVLLIPLVVMLRGSAVSNTPWVLIFPYVALGLPFQVFVMRGFFRLLPDELVEAARVDGASEWWIYLRIMMPLSVPALVTLFIIDAVATWNELLVALVLTNSDSARTVPIGLLRFQGQFTSLYTQLMAGVLIAVLPVLVVYILLQRYIVSGLAVGALKE